MRLPGRRPFELASPSTPQQSGGTQHGLTKREVELCALLARGRNGRAISDQPTLSYSAVKTHVKHIYMKLDVHTQQELIDLVEGGSERQEGT
ncbi:LuxR family transcriptional regulator [Enterorhabdus sp. NM05_H27]|nr:LuxR family transcriptional regulator [Enterorhabdus sp. NM05_H27]